ncbi:MAG: NGG1p interacting factor NIF3 [Spirochaetales bacterium]|nr:NGG1p interacting factor NIF3 [Spirochaetales bacterium]
MYKLVVFVPVEHKEKVKDALFEVGAGSQGLYSRCSWETEGTGQFMPMEGSSPAVGEHKVLEQVPEVRVEMLVTEEIVPLCIEAIRVSHPYEEPAFEFYKVFRDESELEGQEWL